MWIHAPVPMLLIIPMGVHLYRVVQRPREGETTKSVDWAYGTLVPTFLCTLVALWAFMEFCVDPLDVGRIFNPEWREHIYLCGPLLAAALAFQWHGERETAGIFTSRLD